MNINKLKNAIGDYVKVRIALFKLELKEHLSDVIAQVIAYIVILLIASLVLLFLSMGLAFFLNQQLGSTYLGFIIVAGFYSILLIAVLVLLLSGKLKAVIEETMLDQHESTEDETA